jgi:hypothetical protein
MEDRDGPSRASKRTAKSVQPRYNRVVRRRQFLPILLLAVPAFAIDTKTASVRGKLVKGPALQTKDGKQVLLSGDDPTMLVLRDPRLANADFETAGHYSDPQHFDVDPIHTHALFVYQNGKKLMVTYWCDVCYIRTFAPGKCWCCQGDTKLDPVDPDTVDKQ